MLDDIPQMTIDSNESHEIEKALKTCLTVVRQPLNVHNFADYFWMAWDRHTIQVEHKQVDEILSSVDHVEEQLSRQLPLCDESYLMYSGTFKPVTNFSTQSYKFKGKVAVPGHVYKACSYTGIIAWFDQLDKCGVTVIQVASEDEIPMALMALYNSSQKPEHSTLKRYIKPKIKIEDKNPYILQLLCLKRIGLGEEGARELVKRFKTTWRIYNASLKELAEVVGTNTAYKLLRAIGKEK
jgi:ERCC4-type nuclease